MTGRLRAPLGWLLVAVLLSGGALKALVNSAVSPVLPMIAAHLGGEGGALAAQFVFAASALGIAVGGPASGWLVLLVGPRRLLFAALAVYALAGAGGPHLEGVWPLLASRFLVGFASVCATTCTITYISERWAGAERARMLGFHTSIGAGAGVLFLLLTGEIAELAGWRGPFALYLSALLLLAAALLVLPPPRGQPPRPGAQDGRALMALAPLFAVVTLFFIGTYVTSTQLPFRLAALGHGSPAVISRTIACFAVSFAAGSAVYGWVRPRLGSLRTFAAALASNATGQVAIGLADTPVEAAAGGLFIGLGAGFAMPWFYEQVVERAPLALRGAGIGLLSSFVFLGQFLNPILITPVAEGVGIDRVFFIVGGLFALAALAVALRSRRGAVTAPQAGED